MMLGMAEICNFTDSTLTSRNFVEGEKVLQAGHVIFCGKLADTDNTCVKLIAFCLQTSKLKGTPHEIEGSISADTKIIEMKCSCKAGLSGKCKHVVAVLLHLHTTDLTTLEETSCTDRKCLWSTPRGNVLENYEPAPLRMHDCFSNEFDKEYATKITEDDENFIKDLLVKANVDSAFSKHIYGRHEEIVPETDNNNVTMDPDKLQSLLTNLPSEIMKKLEDEKCKILPCCESFLSTLSVDTQTICEETFYDKRKWLENRQFRITGARCYKIYTYTNNAKPDWESKSLKYFYPKSFKPTTEMSYGIKHESEARETYSDKKGVEVFQFGLIVPTENPWLGFSPDGVVFDENGMPKKLIEIKCPFKGKTQTAEKILHELSYINLPSRSLKEKHEYYGQIQLGMAILNLKTCDFVIYSSFDKSIVVISIDINLQFLKKMLPALKKAYFQRMLHFTCIKNGINT